MSGNPPKSFEHNVIFRVSALSGLFPFPNESSFQLNKSLFVCSFGFSVAAAVVGRVSVLNDLNQMYETKFYYFNLSIGVVYTAGLMLAFPSSLSCPFLNRDVMQETFQAMKNIQSTFKTMKFSRFNNWTHLLPFLDILAPVLCSVLVYLIYSDLLYTTFGTCFSLSHIGISLICGQFSFLVDLIGDIFDKGIEFLNEMKLSLIIKRHNRKIFEVVKAINQLGSWKEFNTVLYQLMIDDKTDEIFNNDKLRMHILMKRELVFNACGFFNLDNSLVHSMIASATTYLVILIQFGRPEIIAR
ncbi:Gustatory receptor 68b [Halyomorpha halys]|nr:Gustatory receptor 68b [Halyomorpha halys]